MTLAEIVRVLDSFVRRQFAVAQADGRFGVDVHLFDEGYVDSVGLVELLAFCEERFGIRVPDNDLLSDDFASVHGIAHIVHRLQPPPATRRAS